MTYYNVRINLISFFELNYFLNNIVFVCFLQYSVAELINFFELNATQVPTVTSSLYKTYMKIEKEVIELSEKALSRTTRINLKLDMKGPYIVFPEYGAVQKYVSNFQNQHFNLFVF